MVRLPDCGPPGCRHGMTMSALVKLDGIPPISLPRRCRSRPRIFSGGIGEREWRADRGTEANLRARTEPWRRRESHQSTFIGASVTEWKRLNVTKLCICTLLRNTHIHIRTLIILEQPVRFLHQNKYGNAKDLIIHLVKLWKVYGVKKPHFLIFCHQAPTASRG